MNMETYEVYSSGEAVLVALDNWITERFRKTYTYDDFDIISNRTLDIIRKFKPGYLTQARKEMLDSFSPENLANIVSLSFLKGFSRLEKIISREGNLGIDASNMPAEIMENYINPYLESYKRIKELMDNLRVKFDSNFPDELHKEDVDASAREIFLEPEELEDFFDNSNQFLLLVEYSRVQGEENSKKELFFFKRTYEAIRDPLKDVIRRMFSDLRKNTGK